MVHTILGHIGIGQYPVNDIVFPRTLDEDLGIIAFVLGVDLADAQKHDATSYLHFPRLVPDRLFRHTLDRLLSQ